MLLLVVSSLESLLAKVDRRIRLSVLSLDYNCLQASLPYHLAALTEKGLDRTVSLGGRARPTRSKKSKEVMNSGGSLKTVPS